MNFLVIGAHPDDPELMAGGAAMLLLRRGHQVKFVSATNGECGHHRLSPVQLAARRKLEARESARIGRLTDYEVLDFPDGQLLPGLDERRQIIRIIREFRADVVISHRVNDYHADHRATAQLVTDAAFLVNVPHVLPTVPALENPPIFAYSFDRFQEPKPFRIDAFVGIDSVLEQKLAMMDCHKSQFYEWLPFVEKLEFSPDSTDRRQFLLDHWLHADSLQAKLARSHDSRVESFQLSEYGREISPAAFHHLLNENGTFGL